MQQKISDRLNKLIPCGAQTYSKSHRYYIDPIIIERGSGCRVTDENGKSYIDFVAALGPVILGYGNSVVSYAIMEQFTKGITFPCPTELELRLAEKLTSIYPMDMVKFLKNGSDATTAAVRLARAYTGRDMICKSGYHGWHDWTIGTEPDIRGIPQAVKDLTVKFEYNNIASLKSMFDKYPGKIAAVILEPIQGNGPENNFLLEVQKLCLMNGSALIFDEIVSGFRYALGGACELYKVTPDLVCIGKGMANGMPISVVGGKREIMNLISTGEAFISTTFGGELLSIAAALATIYELQNSDAYNHIWLLGRKIKLGLFELINKYKLSGALAQVGLEPFNGVTFNDFEGLSYLDIWSLYAQRLEEEGILSHGMHYLMMEHGQKEVDLLLEATDKAFADIREAIDKGSAEGMLSKKINPVFKRR